MALKTQIKEYILKHKDSYSRKNIEKKLLENPRITRDMINEVYSKLPPSSLVVKNNNFNIFIFVFFLFLMLFGLLFGGYILYTDSINDKFNLVDSNQNNQDYLENLHPKNIIEINENPNIEISNEDNDFKVIGFECTDIELLVVIEGLKKLSGNSKFQLELYSYKGQDNEKKIISNNISGEFINITSNEIKVISVDIENKVYGTFSFCIGDECSQSVNCYADYDNNNDFICMKKSENEQDCVSTDFCLFENNICYEFDCREANNKNYCEEHNECLWDDTPGYCKQTECYDFLEESNCSNNDLDLNCTWFENRKCIPEDAIDYHIEYG